MDIVKHRRKRIGGTLPEFLQTNEFNTKSKSIIDKYGEAPIVEVRVCRKPIGSETILNIGTLGEYKRVLKEFDYDHLFHLWIEFRTNKHLIILEKNGEGKVELSVDKMFHDEDIQTKDYQLSKPTTLIEIINRTMRAMGTRFFRYDARNNNCQVFVTYVLHSNKLFSGDPTAFRWINQNVTQVFESLPKYVTHLTNLMTDIDGVVDLDVGHGRKRKTKKNIIFSNDIMPAKKVNPWITHVKQYAKAHNMSYMSALKSASCKSSYKKK